jgi:ferredoxin-NADP reductase
MTTWYNAKVINILDESPTVKRFFLEVIDVPTFDFKAGQFITFDLPIGEKRLQRWRSYSIASMPDESNVIELCIVKLEGGLGTSYFFDQVTIGALLKFKGPDGTFCLPEQLDKRIVMICTGTGIAPFRSMILDVLQKKRPFQQLHLIFGCRNASDLLYRAELTQLAALHPSFTFDIALSREVLENTYTGYVHQIYLEKYENNIANTLFYICGWSKMIDEAVSNLLLKMGCDKKQIIYELYG